jgi:hypothetical protein
VARRHGIAPSLLFRWRREALDVERTAALAPQPAFIPLCLPRRVSVGSSERTQSGIAIPTWASYLLEGIVWRMPQQPWRPQVAG